MKKIGIITLYHDNDNYGGVAQAYALNKYLEEKGFDSEIIDYKKTKNINEEFLDNKGYFFIKIKRKISSIIKKMKEKKYINEYQKGLTKRHEKLKQFRDNIKHSETYNSDTIKNINGQYDVYITGSDQTWNPRIIDEAFTFNFVDNNQNVISYASSIATDNYNEQYENFIKKTISKYKYISVREEISSKQLSNSLNRNVEWVVDPTMLVSKNTWKSLVNEKRLIDEKYIITYILGDSKLQRKKIEKFARTKNMKLVTIPFIKNGNKFSVKIEDINFGDIQMIDISFNDFLNLICYSEYVVTDSFHAVSFSYIFEKEFFVISRNSVVSMNSRIDSILKILNLEDRFIKDENIPIDATKIDYQIVNENAKKYINSSERYILNAVGYEVN